MYWLIGVVFIFISAFQARNITMWATFFISGILLFILQKLIDIERNKRSK